MPDQIASKKVLIIDDFEENAMILKECLEDSGFNVRIAPDGETGLEAAKDMMPNLILLDIMLPRMDGYEVLDRLLKLDQTCQIPVICMTAYTSLQVERDRKQALKLGACDFLRKPFSLGEMVARVQEHTQEPKRVPTATA